MIDVITYPCWDIGQSILVKAPPPPLDRNGYNIIDDNK